MIFNRLALKLLRQENSRLRAEKRLLQRRIDELLDLVVHKRAPERFGQTNAPPAPNPFEQWESHAPSDAYSAALAAAKKEAEKTKQQ